jgi:disulfide bond formation protein DsbB
MLNLSPARATQLIFMVMLATIIGAWIFEYAGYPPCELCLKQRWAYYAVVPLTGILAVMNPPWLKQALWLVFLILLASMIFGIYHSGVEWKFWAGPSTCTGGSLAGGLPDLTKPAVMCDQPAIRIFGISLAGYNAIISGAMAWVAAKAARR